MSAHRRAQSVLPAGSWNIETALDSISLDHDHRHRRRLLLASAQGHAILLDLAQTTRLRENDGLVLDDGAIIQVRAKPEALLAITAPDPHTLLRLAWHLGNRHLAVQILPDQLRIAADHVIADMVRGLGGSAQEITAPFDPEAGAYADNHDH
jgi:urease accessory protein